MLIEVELILKPMINCHGREAAVYKVCHSVMSVVLPILTFRGVSVEKLEVKTSGKSQKELNFIRINNIADVRQ